MNDILFGNNNKAVIKKLANRSFRSNKMRNVIAAIAIALTTFLFTAVLTIGMGASGTLEYSMAKMMGSSADALVQGLSEDQFQQLKQNAMFEKVGCWIPSRYYDQHKPACCRGRLRRPDPVGDSDADAAYRLCPSKSK